MANITVVKDLVKRWEVTEDLPSIFGGSDPTFEEYKGSNTVERISGDSDNPNEEAITEEILDGRDVQASVENNFAQMIFEAAGSDSIYDTFKKAADENSNLWLRRTGVQAEAYGEIIGGELGLTCSIAKQRPNSEGHRMFVVNFTAVGPLGGSTIDGAQKGS